MKRCPSTAQIGLTLTEIPIALLVLVLVIALAARIFSTAGSVQSVSQLGAQATSYAAAKLNELEALPSGQVADGGDRVDSPTGIRYTRAWTVSAPIQSSRARTVEIEVSWTSAGRTEKIKVATLLR